MDRIQAPYKALVAFYERVLEALRTETHTEDEHTENDRILVPSLNTTFHTHTPVSMCRVVPYNGESPIMVMYTCACGLGFSTDDKEALQNAANSIHTYAPHVKQCVLGQHKLVLRRVHAGEYVTAEEHARAEEQRAAEVTAAEAEKARIEEEKTAERLAAYVKTAEIKAKAALIVHEAKAKAKAEAAAVKAAAAAEAKIIAAAAKAKRTMDAMIAREETRRAFVAENKRLRKEQKEGEKNEKRKAAEMDA